MGNEAGFFGCGSVGVADEAVGDVGVGGEEGAQLGGGGILADEADHGDLGFEADDLHGDVGGPSGHLVLVEDVEDLDGGLGAEAVGAVP